MTRKGKKLEPKLHLDMDFGEALERFIQTKPEEVEESIKRSKTKKPSGPDKPAPTTRRRNVAKEPTRRKKKAAD